MSNPPDTIEQLLDRHARDTKKRLYDLAMLAGLLAIILAGVLMVGALRYMEHLNAPRGASPTTASAPSSVDAER